ncbi:MAG: UbiD family decarboxylase [Kiritimatiellales bacterium]|nr:UbiD family decarboxylase [Kiritimatiellales bacterium]
MSFRDLREFIQALEMRGELVRVTAEVDPDQEITIIQHKVLAAGGPALLFENVKGSPYRIVSNLYGTKERVELVIGRPPAEIGEEMAGLAEELMPPTVSNVWKNRKKIFQCLKMRMKTVGSSPVLEEIHEPANLNELPVLKCWPLDGGHFFTLPLVHTADPETGGGNLGIYRMQRYDDSSTGMHWQIEKGGGFHFKKACAMGQPLPVSVVLGGPPALTLAAIAPLPEGMDERLLAALLLDRPLEVLNRKKTGHKVSAQAEFILEGCVKTGDDRREGPFGDHLGHYSHSAGFPVYRVDRVLARKDAIYPATVVGKPPQEDFYIGNALQEMCVPLLKMIKPGITDLWSYAETGFHPLAAMSVNERYGKEALKYALGVLGEGQLSLTKVLMVVDNDVNVRDFHAVSRALREHLDPVDGLHLLAPTAQDTLDFTGPAINFGSRLLLLANKGKNSPLRPAPPSPPQPADVHPGIRALRALGEGVLIFVVSKDWKREEVQDALKNHPVAKQYVLHVAVSDDVDIESDMMALWGWFTRFDPYMDIHPAEREVRGNKLILHPPLLIDATWKEGYRLPVKFDPQIEKRVNDNWYSYGISL